MREDLRDLLMTNARNTVSETVPLLLLEVLVFARCSGFFLLPRRVVGARGLFRLPSIVRLIGFVLVAAVLS